MTDAYGSALPRKNLPRALQELEGDFFRQCLQRSVCTSGFRALRQIAAMRPRFDLTGPR